MIDTSSHPTQHTRPLILVIEDNPITRKMIRVTLEKAGYATLEAADGRTALDHSASYAPDLIIQDLLLPDMDSFDLIQQFRVLHSSTDVPIIACSGFLPRSEVTRISATGFTDFLTKPIEPSQLLQTIQAYLPLHSASDAKPGQGQRILVADDDPIQRKLLSLHLSRAGFQVTSVGDGLAALDEALRAPPAAIVSDVLMPGLDGFKLCMAIRQEPRLAHVPVVLVTASYVEDTDRQLALNTGAAAFILRTPDFREVIETLLDKLSGQAPVPPMPPIALPSDEHTHRVIRQLERQMSMNIALAQNAALQAAQLSVLAGVSEVLTRTLDSEQILDEVLARFLDAAGTSLGAIYLITPDGRLLPRAQIGYNSAEDRADDLFFGHIAVLHQVMEDGEPLGIPSARMTEDQSADLLARAGVGSLLITPLVSGEERLGVIVMGSANRNLGEDWIAFAKAVGFQISQTIALGRTVAQLAASEQRFRDLVHDLDAILWEADAQTWRFSFVSQRAEDLLGYPIEQWLATPTFWTDRIHPDDRAQAVVLCRAAIAEERDQAFEYRTVTADQRLIWVREIVHVVPGGQGAARLRGLTVDITEQKRLEEQFRQSQKMEAVGRLAGGVAHDFNNLLTAITGYCEILLSDFEPYHSRRGDIEQIKRAADRATALTHQLLAFSRRQRLAPQILDLNAAVSSIDRLLRRVIGEDIDLVTVLAATLGYVKADPGQIEQVIMNLAINARDAMPQGGKLIIETSNVDLDPAYASRHIAVRPGPYVLLAVSDTGSGIDPETLSHIFEPFFTTKEQGKGTGLGLSTVYGIVKQSGGNVWVYSEQGYGTTFKVYLPRVTENAVPAESRIAPSQPTRGHETILLVEDEEVVRTLVRTILQRNGYRVLEAQHGVEAIAIAEQHEGPIGLLITDVVMPMMSGPDLARQLAPLRPDMKVLYISGYTGSAIVYRGVLEDDALFLQKPFAPSELARKVREVLDADPDR